MQPGVRTFWDTRRALVVDELCRQDRAARRLR